MMKKCGKCFRYTENWRDAEAKGASPVYYGTHGEYSHKPRSGIITRCMAKDFKIFVDENEKACKQYHSRWTWNFEQWWVFKFKHGLKRKIDIYIRVPLGSLRKPVRIGRQDSYNCITDSIDVGKYPMCPRCGEMPYSFEQCVFCGQRFFKDGNDE